MLVLATGFWSLSFPTMKALTIAQQNLLPESSTWFISSLCIAYRFGAAALVMVLFSARTLRGLTGSEVWEGVGMGVFGSAGILFQMDGLAYTSASTSAFLTQCYCLIIPLWIALEERRWPPGIVVLSCLMVIAGVAVLSGVNWQTLRLGRGEVETLVAAVIFTGQILWLQRPKFAANSVTHFTTIMFVVMTLCCLPVACMTTQHPRDWVLAYNSPAILSFMALLVLFCTLGGYLLMNYWQPHLPATQAGLIYCAEPLFVSLVAMFLPGWLSRMAGIDYPNERVGINLLLGGGLITGANLLIQMGGGSPDGAVVPPPAPAKPEVT